LGLLQQGGRAVNSVVKFPYEKAGRRLIFGIAASCMVVPVVLFILYAFGTQKATILAEAEVFAFMITGQINQSPEYWRYENVRLSSILRQHKYDGHVQECKQLFDNAEHLIAEDCAPLPSPPLNVEVPVYDAGNKVGLLKISRSLRPALLQAALLFATSCAFGAFVYFVLQKFPLKMLRSTFVALQREKQQASVTLRSIADAVITTNDSLLIQTLNPAAEQFGGVTSENAAGEPFGKYFRIIHPMTRKNMDGLMAKCLQTKQNRRRVQEQVILVRPEDGCEYQAEITVAPLCNEMGKLFGLVVAFHDVTESRALEQKLREKMLELVHIVRYAGVGIAFVRAGIVQKLNSAAAEILGLPQEQIVGREVAEVLHSCLGYTGRVDGMYDLLGNGEILDMERHVIRADGKRIWVRLIGQRVAADQLKENGTVWIAQDITQMKMQQEQIEMARIHAEETSRFKSEFIAHVSHELRSPLNGIIGMTHLVLDSRLDELQRQYLNIVDDSAKTLLQLINNILDLSKIESGVMELEEKRFRITSVYHYVQNTVALQLREKGLSLSFSIADDVPDELIGDELRLGQVLLNLVGNAIKFTSGGGGEVVCDKLVPSESGVQRRFKVVDTGCGIEETARKKIFEAFVQASSSVARTHGGSGLGLSICKKIIRMMHGDIWVNSAPGQGTTVLFTARFASLDKTGDGNGEQPQRMKSVGEAGAGTRRILVVEDLPMNQTIVKLLLEQEGHTVQIANNGREALLRLSEADFDMIFLDVQMPVMDGLTTARLIRRCETEKNPLAREEKDLMKAVARKIGGHHIPIIGMTGNAMTEGERDCLAAGMDGYISKPFERRDILRTLETVNSMQKIPPVITVDSSGKVLFEKSPLIL